MAGHKTPGNIEDATSWRTVVTFESDKGDPVVVRGEIVDSDAATVARKAVFRALPDATRSKYRSVVIVLDRLS